jgi:hypothetical protein
MRLKLLHTFRLMSQFFNILFIQEILNCNLKLGLVQQSESPETVDLSRRERLALVGPASKRYQDFHSVPLGPELRQAE